MKEFKNIPRTSNAIESWYRNLNCNFNSAHPNLAILIKALSNMELQFHFNLVQIKAGRGLDVTVTNFKKEKELSVICMNYNEFERESYFLLIETLM